MDAKKIGSECLAHHHVPNVLHRLEKSLGSEDLAPRQVPTIRHRLEKSILKYGFLNVLFGASMMMFSTTHSSPNQGWGLVGISLLFVGSVLLILSQFRNLGAAATYGAPLAHNEPNRRRWLEDSLRRYGLPLMLFGASIVMVTVGNSLSACNPEHVFLGISMLVFGFVLLILSELRNLGAGEGFMPKVVGALDTLFGQHR